MNLEHVYHLSDDEISEISTYSFKMIILHDDLCIGRFFLQNHHARWALPYLLKHYLCSKTILLFYSDSKDLNCVMVLFDSTFGKTLLYRLRLLHLIIKLIPIAVGVHSIRKVFIMLLIVWICSLANGRENL